METLWSLRTATNYTLEGQGQGVAHEEDRGWHMKPMGELWLCVGSEVMQRALPMANGLFIPELPWTALVFQNRDGSMGLGSYGEPASQLRDVLRHHLCPLISIDPETGEIRPTVGGRSGGRIGDIRLSADLDFLLDVSEQEELRGRQVKLNRLRLRYGRPIRELDVSPIQTLIADYPRCLRSPDEVRRRLNYDGEKLEVWYSFYSSLGDFAVALWRDEESLRSALEEELRQVDIRVRIARTSREIPVW